MPVSSKRKPKARPDVEILVRGGTSSGAGVQPRIARRRVWALGAKTLIAVALIAWCISRARNFQIRPLDAPGTLHPLLVDAFASLVDFSAKTSDAITHWQHWCYWGLAACFLLALINHYGAQGVLFGRGAVSRFLRSRKLFFLSVAVCLVLFRAPLLLGGASNVDESQFIASALKLFKDPVYFRSVDCGTTGPFNIYVLMLPALAGLSPDYASSRGIALGIIFLSLYFLYRAFCLIAPENGARITVLSALVFFCVVTHPDFVHYSSEHLSLLLISIAFYVCVRIVQSPESYKRPLAAMGLLAAVAFFAKMQAVPIIACMTGAILLYVYRSRTVRRLGDLIVPLAVGFVPLPLINTAVCLMTGTLRDFWMSYIEANWLYTRHQGPSFFSQLPALLAFMVDTWEFRAFVIGFFTVLAASIYQELRPARAVRSAAVRETILSLETAALGCAVVAAGVYGADRLGTSVKATVGEFLFLLAAAMFLFLVAITFLRDRRIGWIGILAAAMVAGCIVSLYAPHLDLTHYLILLVIPMTAATGWLLVRRGTRSEAGDSRFVPFAREWSPPLSLTLVFIAFFGLMAFASQPHLEYNFWAAHKIMGAPEGDLIQSLTRPGSSIVVWGWYPKTYLDAGRVPATRDTNMSRFFGYGKQIDDYSRDRFLRDLTRRPADLVVDALDVSCCFMNDRKTQGFESVPEIAAYIHAHYVKVAERFDERFYLRRDLVSTGQPASH